MALDIGNAVRHAYMGSLDIEYRNMETELHVHRHRS